MRVLYDPATIALSIGAGAAVFGAASSAAATRDAAESEAASLKVQAEQERKQRLREQTDIAREREQTLSRTRAVLAAAGGGAGDPGAVSIIGGQASQFARQSARLLDDSQVREATLETRAKNVRRRGSAEASGQIFGGAARAAGLLAPTFTGGGETSGGGAP